MDRLIDLLEEISLALADNDFSKYTELGVKVNECIWSVIPVIIASYSDPRMKDIAGDALYWPAQTEKILNALLGKDFFYVVDVLYFETRAKLIEYRDVIRERNIELSI